MLDDYVSRVETYAISFIFSHFHLMQILTNPILYIVSHIPVLTVLICFGIVSVGLHAMVAVVQHGGRTFERARSTSQSAPSPKVPPLLSPPLPN